MVFVTAFVVATVFVFVVEAEVKVQVDCSDPSLRAIPSQSLEQA